MLHDRTLELADAILKNRNTLLDILVETATRTAAEDEINRSLRAISGAAWEIERNRPPQIGTLSVFLPSNNVLYSYMLFGVIPSLYTDRIEIRPSSRTRETAKAVHELLAKEYRFDATGQVSVVDASQKDFVASCRQSDAVVFTGQYENGLDVMERVGERPCFMLFGSGPNPMVIGPEAVPGQVNRALISSRLYNSGQDCLCTDLVFVHRSVLREVLADLKQSLRELPVTDRRLPGAVVAPLVYADAAREAEAYIADHAGQVVFGGGADMRNLQVEPTVILHESSVGLHPPEFFSPIFSLVPYDDPAEIERWAASREEMERGMYATVFGEPQLTGTKLGSATILRDMTTFDHEDGNKPFGGHGPQAGSVRGNDGRLQARPLLLSAELAAWAGR
ncbi:aldehyde dehydrogenase family protein [Streptomyces sp. YGL11-2]|uniref:aldehyde dehydrogenase family protein n=1 Tax=Streptomyces sp. YGL11-2 TaxID=3414028 RepID=UPI003CFA9B18